MLSRDAITGYRAVDALKSLGVRVIVDDFGTGACSLAQLAHSPVDGIKIDNSLVAGIETVSKTVSLLVPPQSPARMRWDLRSPQKVWRPSSRRAN